MLSGAPLISRVPKKRDAVLTNLAIAKYRVKVLAADPITLPRCKGSVFHGGFGHALEFVAPELYRYLYSPHRRHALGAHLSKDIPNPFVLVPPLDDCEVYLPGHPFSFDFTLFGDAMHRLKARFLAVKILDRQDLGLGKKRGKYIVKEIWQANIDVEALFWIKIKEKSSKSNSFCTAFDIATLANRMLSTKQVTVHLITRLRLKHDNRIVKETPLFVVFFERLVGRLKTLGLMYGQRLVISERCRHELCQHARGINIKSSTAKWIVWSRYSKRERRWMKFGGLLSDITYQGNLEPFLPYLKIGEWAHVGIKTSFGLGKYEVMPV